MKTQVATVLALVGVLGAGSAAALVNTSILDSPTESGASAAVLPPASSVDVPVPPPTVAAPTTSTPKPAPSTSTSSTTSTTTTVPAPPSSLTAFNVGDAGVVTVDIVDGRLILLAAEPTPGWAVTDTEQDDDGIEVDFESGTVRVRFEASIEDDRIVPHVESEAIGSASRAAPAPAGSGSSSRAGSGSPAPVTAPPAQASSRDDDDHDDDEYEYEERDDHEEHDDDHGEVERDDD
jgi:hypothetical protein